MCYTYDSLNRVRSRTIKDMADVVISTENYTYDAAGNITDAPNSSFTYDNNNRLTTFNGNAVSYDLDGNMLSNGATAFEYDSANRLLKAGGHTYTYNAEDVRIRNLCSDADTTYTYNTNCKLNQLLTKTTNGITTKYVYGNGLIGEEKCGEFKTYHFDFRGSTVAITNATGEITDTFKYDTYGNITEHIGNSFVIFGYNGRDGVVTDKNGLIYMRARYYSPAMRRFINADIIHGQISDSTSLNRYSYVNGNPVSFVDPFGLEAERGVLNLGQKTISYTSSNHKKQYTSVDINNDGNIDYYIYSYSYSYTTGFWFWKKTKTVTGNVYIYIDVTTSFFENSANIPENFNSKTDIMIGDFTDEENPTMYAYQAQKVDSKNREYIIEIMQMYDQEFNTAWDRTNKSLKLEWEEHHKYRNFDDSAQNIDFDNNEEGYSSLDYFEKAVSRGVNKIFNIVKSKLF